MSYTINYNTGITDDGYNDLDDAKAAADRGASYTSQDITIEDKNGNEITRRPWYSTEYDGDEDGAAEDPIRFGDAGHYGDWQ